jgi:hypothetical protein
MFDTIEGTELEPYSPRALGHVNTEEITRRVAVLLGRFDSLRSDEENEICYLGRELRERLGA